jgi:hypothetical protein
MLRALGGDTTGSARLRFRRRCLTTMTQLRLRGVAPGNYTLDLDGVSVASFEVGERGRATVDVPGVDPRASRIAISDLSGVELFTGAFVTVADDSSRLTLEMVDTGAAQGVSGTVYYRSVSGREELTVWARNLPAGAYDVRVGDSVVGSLTAPGPGHSVLVRFDSSGADSPLAVTPICKSVRLISGATVYLRSRASDLAFDGCGPTD